MENELTEKQRIDISNLLQKVLENYRLSNMYVEDDETDHYPLVDLLTPDGCNVDIGKEEIELIVDDFACELFNLSTPENNPPSSK